MSELLAVIDGEIVGRLTADRAGRISFGPDREDRVDAITGALPLL